MKDFLLELHTEELPPKLLPKLIKSLADNFATELTQENLTFTKIKPFVTPRRLAILIEGLSEKQTNKDINKKGPSVNANENAIKGFAKSNGIEVESLTRETTDKGDYYYFKNQEIGKNTKNLLAKISQVAIKNIPLVRPMRWADFDFSFIRPAHSLILLFGDDVIDGEIMGLKSSRNTTGLRFVKDNKITIDSAKNYQKIMLDNQIEVCFETRKSNILKQIQTISAKNHLEYIENDLLLDEVCGLVEYPQAFIGSFATKFLDLPKEVIIKSMAEHQKYFATTKNGKLTNKFIAISNIKSKNEAVIIAGNEKVIRPRLEDAEFFFSNDKKTTLESKLTNLQTVLFMQGLGTMFEKTKRLEKLAGKFAENIGADTNLAMRAGKLAKADLTSNMVGEFASLQGIMGGYYAVFDGENSEVSIAINQHYRPKFAGDDLPKNLEGLSVALADKIDTICGIFAIGNAPTGSKDPYALRRLALGFMRIIIEKQINLSLVDIIKYSLNLYSKFDEKIAQNILEFMLDRLKSYYKDKGIKTTSILAASSGKINNPYDLHLRIIAIDKFSKTTDGKEIIAINKRIVGILKGAKYDNNETLNLTIEKELREKIKTLDNTNNYDNLMQNILELKPTLDKFFIEVIVNDEDENLRNARLTLLKKVANKLATIGDLTIS